MRTKGVLLLVFIVCCTAVCNAEDGNLYDYGIGDTLSKELAEDYMFQDDSKNCETDEECNGGECKGGEGQKICSCKPGLGGDKCEIIEDCVGKGKYSKCKESGGVCDFDGTEATCKCTDPQTLDEELGICRKTCEDGDCEHGTECKASGDHKFCKCTKGLSGDKCNIVDECVTGTFKNCKSETGTCKYDEKGKKAVCTCPDKKALDSVLNYCIECNCGEKGTCSFVNGNKKCECSTGYLEDNGVCKECNCGEKGTCSFVNGNKKCECSKGYLEDNGVCKECDCGPNGGCNFVGGKKTCKCNSGFGDKNGKCTETCEDGDCQHGTDCIAFNEQFFCNCTKGLSGDKCNIVDECGTEKFKNCKPENGTCGYDEKGKKAVCACPDKKALDSVLNYCIDCDCGENGKCSVANGKTECACNKNFALKDGKCEECNCGEKGTCSFVNGNKKCVCFKGYLEDNGVCKECDCGNYGKCDFKEGHKNCTCNPGYVVKEKDGKCHKCDCGTGGTCHFDGDTAACTCKEGYKIHDEKCKECDCGQNGRCELDGKGEKVCSCENGYAIKNVNNKKKCVATCNDDCENGGKCVAQDGGEKFCSCNSQLEGDKCEIVIDCVRGQFRKCEDSGGECAFKDSKSACTCAEPKKLDPKRNICRTKCSKQEGCKNRAKCENDLCQCLTGTEGDDCGRVTACDTLKCEEKNADCTYDSSKTPNTFCVCTATNYIFVEKEKRCVEKCSKDGFCQNGGTCSTQTNLCECKPKTSGDQCEKIEGCDSLKCKDINAECIYDVKSQKPTCRCLDKGYDYENGKCNPKWCKTECNTAGTTCEYKDGVGICKCKSTGSYYDYAAKACKNIDKCFNITCEGKQICNNGACKCPENHKQNYTTCEPMDLCNPNNKCFNGAQCEKGSSSGYVRCLCNSESSFYLPRSRKCEDGVCFLNVERKNCTKTCPTGMERKEGDCKHSKEEKKCDKDCGFLGWCEKVSDTEHKCLCDPNYAEVDTKTKKCVLKASAVCPTKERDGDNKCKCVGKYKQAKNGITCELKSCSDEDVKKECKNKGATKCVDNWKNDVGYNCVCPDGYINDPKKGCIDICSQDKAKDKCSSNGQVCYIGDKDRVGDCRCPPTFTLDSTKTSCDVSVDNTFMIHGLQVLSKKYETTENNINKVVLNRDVSTSMKQAFANLDFVHVFSFKVKEDVLICDVWLQFKANLPTTFNATLEVRRWKSLTVEGQNQLLLPPQLLLTSTDAASEEELTLCTDSVRLSVCGSGSTCVNNKCNCSEGFREIDSTLKVSSGKRIVRCEDIDECTEAKHDCKENSQCVNTLGDYFCKCKPGFKKAEGDADAMDKKACIGLCDSKPCGKGTCELTKEKTIECTCQAGYSGSFCNKEDVNLAKAGKATKVVGAVLGTLLAIVIILIIVYIVRQRKNSYSEDFTPAPRVDNAEMIERRPMRGVTNRAYQ